MRFNMVIMLSVCMLALPATAADYTAFGAGYRLAGIPDFILDAQFRNHQPILAHGLSAEFSIGQKHRHWNFGAALATLGTPPGFWTFDAVDSEGADAYETWHVDLDAVGFASVFASYTWNFELLDRFYFSPTVGLGVAAVLGDAYMTEALPGCEDDVSTCAHWNDVTRKAEKFFSPRVGPLVILAAAFSYRFWDATHLSLDFGFMDLPFVGLSVRQGLPGAK